tara:strand:+ start:474 stop:665 length:192 start_codon:yes stop_codon:yes gene_type:complete
MSGNFPQIKNILQRSSFYATSKCRDLCFNTQAHRFTFAQPEELLNSNNFNFLGFLLPKPIKFS